MKVLVAYRIENQIVAHKLVSEIGNRATVEKVPLDNDNGIKQLAALAAGNNSHVVLLLSDNFLKTENCLNDALGIVQTLSSDKRLTPVITDGTYQQANGEYFNTPTSFERVSNVIQYMNHWQDRYLELRRTKHDPEDFVFAEKLRVVRAISSEIGELLRFLRSTECLQFAQLQQNGFQPLFDSINNTPQTATADAPPSAAEAPQVAPVPPKEMVKAPIKKVETSLEEMLETAAPIAVAHVAEKNGSVQKVEPPKVENNITAQQLEDLMEDTAKKPSLLESLVEEAAPQKGTNGSSNGSTSLNANSTHEPPQKEATTAHDLLSLEENNTSLEEIFQQAASIAEVLPTDIDGLKKYIAEYPKSSAAQYQLAALLVQNEQFTEANDVLEQLIGEDKTNADAYVLMAFLAEKNKDFLLAKSCLEKVTMLNPDYDGIHYKLGTLANAHFKGQKKAAAHYFEEALRRDTNNVDAQYQYAVIKLEHFGDYDKAIAAFKQTLALDPKHPRAAFELAVAYYELGEKADAAHYYREASEIDPTFKTPTNDEIFKYEAPKPAEVPFVDNGLTVLITGATSGIGKATAAIFAQHGYRLILTGRRSERLDEIKTALNAEHHNRIQTIQFDVRNLEEVKKAINKLDEEWRNVDILINNAGLALGFSPIHEGDITDWDTMIDTNIKGLLYMTRAVAPLMVARKKGHILNICSVAGKDVYPNGNVYAATKHAVDALTKAMRLDLFKHNIRVSQIAPGHVEETEFALVRFHGDTTQAKIYEDFKPLTSSDVAETIFYILTRPEHINIQDVLIMSTQQASVNFTDRTGRNDR